MQEYEYLDDCGRALCRLHHRLRCDECFYVSELREQNKCYREALEFYADEEHYKEELISEAQYDADGICISNDEYAPPIIYFDSGEIARKALKGEN